MRWRVYLPAMPRKTHAISAQNQSAPTAETAAKLRALVRVLARMAAEEDYRKSKLPVSSASKGSIK
jgi:hypothetical protein